MNHLDHRGARKCGRLLLLAASLLSVAMLLTLPSTRNHDFAQHFANAEVRRAVGRNTFLVQSERESTQRPVLKPETSRSLEHVERDPSPRRRAELQMPPVPIALLLSRLKLGPSHSRNQEPLL